MASRRLHGGAREAGPLDEAETGGSRGTARTGHYPECGILEPD